MNTAEGGNGPKIKILAVDDEPTILLGLKHQLSARGYEVTTCTGGRQALLEIRRSVPDLLLLDLMMPDIDGLTVTRQVREFSSLPIIVLSARGEEQKKVEALDLGADDYLTKPFGLDELLARIRVALRHKNQANPALSMQTPGSIIGNQYLSIDLEEHRVFIGGVELKLTPKQHDLLLYLAKHPGRLVTYRMLLQTVWGAEYGDETQYVHVYIGQLRQKIEPDPAKPRYIITEPGLGYRFQLPEEE